MKFRLVLIFFNVLITGSFLLLFFIPVAVMGWEFSGTLLKEIWYIPLIFFVLMGLLNLYFFINRRYFTLMEQERWQDVLDYLDDDFYKKSRGKRGLYLNSSRVRVYINASLVASQSSRLLRLEAFLRENHPGIFEEFFLFLGLPRLMKEEPGELEAYYKEVFSLKNPRERGWCVWIYTFSLLMQKKITRVNEPLLSLLEQKDMILRLLASYLLSISLELSTDGPADRMSRMEKEKENLRAVLTPRKFKELKEKEQGNVLFFALDGFINQAYAWLNPAAGE